MEQINNVDNLGNSSEEKRVVMVRHFDDIDDLETYGRDAVLLDGQEKKTETVANILFNQIKEHGKKAILFVTSPRVRTKLTASMIIDALHKEDSTLRCVSVEENDLRAIDQGEFILPADYVKGQKFEGLSLADQIFFNETHASEVSGREDNYDYKYGDPVLLKNGQFQYPELARFFTKSGESYRDVLVRLYALVITMSQKVYKLEKNTELVLVTHGQPGQIFKDLKKVAELIKNNNIEYKQGELAKLCWEIYKKRDPAEKVTGATDVIAVEELTDSNLIGLLKQELLFLKQ